MAAAVILYNGSVLTMDPSLPAAQAVAIGHDGRIAAVGSLDELERHSGPTTNHINLDGKTVVPGFNDCHMHILPYGLDLARADLSPQAGIRDVPSLVRALQKWAEANPNAEWVVGSRYDQNTFPNAAHPTRQDLDRAFPDRPVYIRQTSGHAASSNSVALKLAGVTRDREDPPGGEIVRGPSGEPTGVLLESAMGIVSSAIPKPTWSEILDAITKASDTLLAKGITSASDLHTGWLDLETEIKAYVEASRRGAPVRMTLFPHAPAFGEPNRIPSRVDFLAEWSAEQSGEIRPSNGAVRIGPLKLFSDGALTTRTAALREPFIDGTGTGMLLHSPDELDSYIFQGVAARWQMAVHAIGDRAIDLVLSCYDDAVSATTAIGYDGRHRIEHAMLLDAELIERIRRQKVIPVVQPEFVSRLGDAYVLGLGEERAARLNPNRTLMKAGIGVPFSSDCPVVPGAPLDGIRAAVRRQTPSGRILGPDESITAEEAIRSYTYWAAFSVFDEHETGTITPGKRADLTILSTDPRQDLDSVRVTATFAAGKQVFETE